MSLRSWAPKAHRALADFSAERSGSAAIFFALALAVLLISVGIAIDYGRAMWASSKLQHVLDAATLAAAKETTDSKRQQAFDQYFAANKSLLGGMSLGPVSLEISGDRVTGTADVVVKTTFLKIADVDSLTVAKRAAVEFSDPPLEIALVLDVSSSMIEKGRFGPMQEAVSTFLSQLSSSGKTDWTVSIVPFSSRINFGLRQTDFLKAWNGNPAVPDRWRHPRRYYNRSYSKMNWIDGTTYAMYNSTNYYWMGCVEPRIDFAVHTGGSRADALSDEAPSDDRFVPMDDNPQSGKSFCPPPIVPLTSNTRTLSSAVSALTSQGSTRLDTGMIGAWYTLSPNWAGSWKSSATAAGYGDVRKIVVFMTDGRMNTQDDPKGKHYDWICAASSNCDACANKALTSICTAMKSDGITIYTVAYDPDADDSYIKACASGDDHFYQAVSKSGTEKYIADIYLLLANDIVTPVPYLIE